MHILRSYFGRAIFLGGSVQASPYRGLSHANTLNGAYEELPVAFPFRTPLAQRSDLQAVGGVCAFTVRGIKWKML